MTLMVDSPSLPPGLGKRPCVCGSKDTRFLCDKRTGLATCDAQLCPNCVDRRPTGDLCPNHAKPVQR